MSEANSTERNIFQKISDATYTVVTPANVMDAWAFVRGIQGIAEHDTWKGIGKSAVGYLTDLVDGPTARITGTPSRLGEIIDATGDKIKMAYALRKIWQTDRAPKSLLTAVAAQNAANAAITIYDLIANDKPQVHPSEEGKQTFAIQEFGIGLNVIGSKVAERLPKTGKAMKHAGTVLGWAGVVRGVIQVTPSYWKIARTKEVNPLEPQVLRKAAKQ